MGFRKEFKEFVTNGNVMDLAIGVIIGAAFGKIVSSLVENVMMPLIGIALQGIRFEDLMVKVGDAEVRYGTFIGAIVDFLIIAAILFFVIKALNKARRKKQAEPEAPPAPTKEQLLLAEIRDLLKSETLT